MASMAGEIVLVASLLPTFCWFHVASHALGLCHCPETLHTLQGSSSPSCPWVVSLGAALLGGSVLLPLHAAWVLEAVSLEGTVQTLGGKNFFLHRVQAANMSSICIFL